MNDFSALIQQGNAWFFIPSAILLGALHGLEPGHSKTMMAAFIIAIKGSIRQAAMLGVAATISHTAIVWLIAFGGMYLSRQFTAESVEPWLQLISAFIILGTAIWMFWRTWKGERLWKSEQRLEFHSHDESRVVDTGHGKIELAIFADERPPRWRLRTLSGSRWKAKEVSLVTHRGTGTFSQVFGFVDKGDYLESVLAVPEPHSFDVRLTLGHQGHVHDYDIDFHQSPHPHDRSAPEALEMNSKEYQDAHELAHANDIKRRFNGEEMSNWQILLFGLTGGLIPCPAAVTVLLICIQLKAFSLGATMVVCFSIGLALTLVTVGVAAAVSVQQATKRWSGFSTIARRAPYFSSVLIAMIGLYMGIHGYIGIAN